MPHSAQVSVRHFRSDNGHIRLRAQLPRVLLVAVVFALAEDAFHAEDEAGADEGDDDQREEEERHEHRDLNPALVLMRVLVDRDRKYKSRLRRTAQLQSPAFCTRLL